jgi:hypothetical protein
LSPVALQIGSSGLNRSANWADLAPESDEKATAKVEPISMSTLQATKTPTPEEEAAALKIQRIHRRTGNKKKKSARADKVNISRDGQHRSMVADVEEQDAIVRIQSVRRAQLAKREAKKRHEQRKHKKQQPEQKAAPQTSRKSSATSEESILSPVSRISGLDSKRSSVGNYGLDNICECGTVFMVDSKFCRTCGRPRQDTDQANEKASKRSTTSHHHHRHSHSHHQVDDRNQASDQVDHRMLRHGRTSSNVGHHHHHHRQDDDHHHSHHHHRHRARGSTVA